MQELFGGEWGNSASSSKKSVSTFWEDYSGSAALELACFYKDEVLIEGLRFGVAEIGGAIEDCAAYED
jgi:hypothetical protein